MIQLITKTFFSRIISALFNFVTIVLLSKELGPEGKGISSQLIALIAVIQIICDLMGGAALVFLGARKSIKSLLLPSYCFTFIILIVAYIWLLFFPIHSFNFPIFHIIALSFFSTTLNQHYHILNSRQKFQLVNSLSVAQALLIVLFIYFLPLKSEGLSVYIFALYIGWCIPWLISSYVLFTLSKYDKPFEADTWKQVLKFGKLNQLGHIIQFSTQRFAYIFLPAFTLGIYSNAVTISESIWMFAASIATIQYGKIANMGNKDEAIDFTVLLLKLTLIITAGIAVFVAFLPDSFYVWLFGAGFIGVKDALLPLLPGIIAIGGYLIIGHFYSGIGQFNKNNYAMLAGLLFTCIAWLIVKYILKSEINYTIAAYITCASNICTFIFVILMFKREFKITWKKMLPTKEEYNLTKSYLNLFNEKS
jgi:O-antigen/teichoic acid export membrane protein